GSSGGRRDARGARVRGRAQRAREELRLAQPRQRRACHAERLEQDALAGADRGQARQDRRRNPDLTVASVAKKTAKKAAGEVQKLKLTLLKSKFGRTPGHAECLAGLGLRNRHQSVVVTATPENRGMIDKVRYMLK